MSFEDYYRRELTLLRDFAADFGREHPSLAPMLVGPGEDPDVERLLEGVAFLTANVERRLDDEFPEVLHTLLQMVAPHYLRPVPSATIMAFAPRSNLNQVLAIDAGTNVDSVPVDGVPCRFTTTLPVEAAPLSLTNAELIERGLSGVANRLQVKLDFQLDGMSLDSWKSDRIRLHITGDMANASDVYFLLRHYLSDVVVATGRGEIPLGKQALKPVGFGLDEALIPYPGNVFPSFRLLQEYFLFPSKFLFVDLDLSAWRDRGSDNAFSLILTCAVPSFAVPRIDTDRFLLFASPAVNLFKHSAEPVLIDQKHHEMRVEPSGEKKDSYDIFSVDRVQGIVRGAGEEREFEAFSERGGQEANVPIYETVFRHGMRRGETHTYLSVAYPPDEALPDQEVLTVDLTCTNGFLPDSLQAGDIRRPTSNTPELVDYRNISTPTTSQTPPLEGDRLWHLLSHLSLNLSAVDDVDTLRSILRLYQFSETKNKAREVANLKRVEGVLDLEIVAEERLIRGAMYRGQRITIKARYDHFASPGDLFLFGCILDHFLGTSASINHYTMLVIEDQLRGEEIEWPARLGDRPLL